jgi:hypothetical protein
MTMTGMPPHAPNGGPPPGFYPYADVQAQLRWWNGYAWEDRWQQVPEPGKRFTWGTGNGTAQVVGGSIIAGFLGLLLIVGLFSLAAVEDGIDLLIALLWIIGPLLMMVAAAAVIYNGRVAMRRQRDRERVGSR